MDRRAETSPGQDTGNDGSHAARAGVAVQDPSHTTEDGSHAVGGGNHNRENYRQFSGQGENGKTFVLFVGGMLTILVSFWLFASYPNSFWLFLLGILAYALALVVPTTIIPGSTAKHSTSGTELTMDLPRNTSEMAQRPGVPDGAQVNH